MKQIQTFLKALSFLFIFLFANSSFSQACGFGYDFTYYPSVTNCYGDFTAVIPGHPSINHITWTIASSGTGGSTCATITSTPNLNYQFCFYGYYDVTMTIYFNGGTSCFVTHTIYVDPTDCTGALECDPDIYTASIPDPKVEITYIGPDICKTTTTPPYHYCMYSLIGGTINYNVACGWTWNIYIPPSSYPCEIFTYWVKYIRSENSGCDSTCVTTALTPGQDLCITAKIDQTIYIVADGNHCCLPAGYQRAYIWTPSLSGGLTPISDPSPTISIVCQASRCPRSGNCTETQQTMSVSSGIPSSACFTGGGSKVEERNNSEIFKENANIDQEIIIFNALGAVIYNGKWKFGDPKNLYLNWPVGTSPGLYFINFQNSTKKGLLKLYKLY